jgi:GWxTD domain-containing protein
LVGALAAAVFPAAAGRLPEPYDRWLTQEVVYLISDEERREFLRLERDPDRDRFIEEFWAARNPLRGSMQNPFRDEHYRRLEHANRTFGLDSNTPGWKTDMGRTYILLGKPQSQTRFAGYGQIYPLELWFYANPTGNPSLPPFFYVLFYMPDGIGEYRYYRPFLDGPLKLVRGSQFRTNRDVYEFLKPLGGDVARAAFSLIPGEPIDTQEFTTSMSGDLLVSRIENFANDSFQLARLREARRLRAQVTSWFLVYQDRPLDLSTLVIADPDGGQWLDYAVYVGEEKLGQREPDGKSLRIRLAYRLLAKSGELILEDAEERSYPAYDGGFRPFLLAGRLPLVSGAYRLEVEVTNAQDQKAYRAERVIEAPEPGRPAVTGPLIAARAEAPAQPDAAAPFQYFGAQFVPSAEAAASGSLRLLFQVQAPESGDYQVEYVVGHVQDRAMRRTFRDTLAASEFRDGRLLKSKTLPLSGLEPGDYLVAVTVRREGSPQVVASSTAGFRIGEPASPAGLYFLGGSRDAAGPAVAAYLRALESLAHRREDRAAGYLAAALERSPANRPAARLLTRILFDQGKHDQVAGLYRRLGLATFRGAPETLAQAAISLWRSGEAAGARQLLEAAEKDHPKHPLLRSAAGQVAGAP